MAKMKVDGKYSRKIFVNFALCLLSFFGPSASQSWLSLSSDRYFYLNVLSEESHLRFYFISSRSGCLNTLNLDSISINLHSIQSVS